MASSISPPSFSFVSTSFPISCTFPPPQKPCKPKRHDASKVIACSSGNPNNNPRNRRDILIGLGGLYGATTLTGSAFGAPLSPPDPTNCVPPAVPDPNAHCCPPSPFIDFQLPPPNSNTPLRIRRAAHSLDKEYIDKYKEPVKLMKALPLDDPHNFMQQANVHCAYCDGGYKQKGFPDRYLDVHSSWLFLPFHRWYLYFYERILGKLIGDPSFALPFWNWDNPKGMTIPELYKDQRSPLYDPFRDDKRQNTVVDLNYGHENPGEIPDKKESNLRKIHYEIVKQGRTTSLFYGHAYRAGCPPNPGPGSIERIHNTVHRWTGDSKQPHGEDMGTLYSAARDPIFFAHHSNIDRIWNIWKTKVKGRGRGKRKDFDDEDWLNSSFFFYDENKNYVRVKIQDCLDSRKLGYDYQDDVPIPWLSDKYKTRSRRNPPFSPIAPQNEALNNPKTLWFPLTLNSVERTSVERPRYGEVKEEREEVLVIDVEYDRSEGVRFDVFINDQGDDKIGPDDSEFAGSFVTLPHSHVDTKRTNTSFRLAITDLLKELDVKDDDSIAVTLLPVYGKKPVTIKGIKIKLLPLVEDQDM